VFFGEQYILLVKFFAIETEFSGIHGNSEFHQQGINKFTGRPYPYGNGFFNKSGDIFVNFTKGAGDKTVD
jgi:hypothetical protein